MQSVVMGERGNVRQRLLSERLASLVRTTKPYESLSTGGAARIASL